MRNKTFLIPIAILLGVGLLFLVQKQFVSDTPHKQGPGNGTENGNPEDPIFIPKTDSGKTSHALRYLAPPGRVLLYEISMVSSIKLVVDLNLQPGQAPATQSATLRLTGLLECAGYQSPRPKQLLLGYRFKEVSFQTDQVPMDPTMQQLLSNQLREEFFVFMTPRGEFGEFYHSSSVMFQLQGMQKALLLHARIILPEDRASTWEEREIDQTGPFVALYEETSEATQVVELSVSKKKAYYESVSTSALSGGVEQGTSVMAFPEGMTTAVFLIKEGHLQQVNQDETLEILGEEFSTGTKVSTQTVFRFLSSSRDKKRAEKSPDDMAKILGGMEASGIRGGSAEEKYLEDQRISRLEKEADGHTVDEILATLRHLIATGEGNSEEAYNAVMILAALLALDDSRVEKIQDLLKSETNLELMEMLTSALGNAGTPAAQLVLVETIADGNIDLRIRTSALVAFAPPMTPSPEAEAAMRSMVNPKDENNLGTNSLFILGVMANRLGTSDPGRSAEIVQHILSQEEAFRNAEQTHFFLGSLANAGHPSAYETIIPYLDSPDSHTRVDAVSALGRMPQAEANPHLVQAMSDKSPEVRISAIQAASDRPGSPNLHGGVKGALLNDPSKEVRHEALNYFAGKIGTDPSIAPLLQQVATSDPDPEIREAAAEALIPE